MITIKSEQEIQIMRDGGKRLFRALAQVLKEIHAGVSTKELDRVAEKTIADLGCTPSFKGYQGFPAVICTSINEQVVHGIPGDARLRRGDIVGIDIGLRYKDFHADMAQTVIVDEDDFREEKDYRARRTFLNTGSAALDAAIACAKAGNFVGDISSSIGKMLISAGYSPVRLFTGHGIGKKLHEEPSIPCFGKEGMGPRLACGMVLAIEVIYNQGGSEVTIDRSDGWTAETADKMLSGLFENTVVVTEKGPLVLTVAEEGINSV